MAATPGTIISRSAARGGDVDARLVVGLARPASPSRRPAISRNWRRTSSIIWLAARPTAFMVRAAKRKGNIAPEEQPDHERRLGEVDRRLIPAASVKAANRASAVTAADPMAKPLATAAVVLPSASRASVASRTSLGRCAISAMPPALSAMGP